MLEHFIMNLAIMDTHSTEYQTCGCGHLHYQGRNKSNLLQNIQCTQYHERIPEQTFQRRSQNICKYMDESTAKTEAKAMPIGAMSSWWTQRMKNLQDDTPTAEQMNTVSNVMHVPQTLVCRPGSWPAFKSNAMAGAFALSSAFAVAHPIDTIKTRIQADSSVHGRIVIGNLFTPGIARVLLKGFSASIFGAAPQGAMRFSTYESCKLQIKQRFKDTHPYLCTPIVSSAVSAMAGDMVSSTVKVPREVLTQRLQATKLYSSTMNAIVSIWKQEGIRGFYTGYTSTQCRDIPFMVFLFSCYENIKSLTGSLCEDSKTASALFGGGSGAFAGLLTTPMDVIKTRIMTSSTPDPIALQQGRVVINHIGIQETARNVLATQGWKGLFAGCAHRSFWWFCVCSVFFPTYEVSKATIHHWHAHNDHIHYIKNIISNS